MNKLKNKGMAALLAELFRKPRGKDLLKGLLLVLGSAVLGTALLAACSLIPAERLQQHLVESAELMQEETLYQKITPLCTSQLDNFTDSIMLKTAADDTQDTPLRRAMMAATSPASAVTVLLNVRTALVAPTPTEPDADSEPARSMMRVLSNASMWTSESSDPDLSDAAVEPAVSPSR